MPFNNNKNGFQNEIDFVRKIEGNEYSELDYKLQLFIDDIFKKVNKKSIMQCYKNAELKKYDIIIQIDDIKKRISVKKGIKNSVHAEESESTHFCLQ